MEKEINKLMNISLGIIQEESHRSLEAIQGDLKVGDIIHEESDSDFDDELTRPIIERKY